METELFLFFHENLGQHSPFSVLTPEMWKICLGKKHFNFNPNMTETFIAFELIKHWIPAWVCWHLLNPLLLSIPSPSRSDPRARSLLWVEFFSSSPFPPPPPLRVQNQSLTEFLPSFQQRSQTGRKREGRAGNAFKKPGVDSCVQECWERRT